MLLPKNSFIRNPPTLIDPKQVVTFNAIRYCIDICDISINRLIKNLSELTEKPNVEPFDFPNILLDIWSIINNSYMFGKIISNELKIKFDDYKFLEINKIKDLRDSNQHLEERINQTLSVEDYPIYGFLSWRKLYPGTNDCIFSTIYSGSLTNKKKLNMSITNISYKEPNEIIQMIEFTNVIRVKKNGVSSFEEQSISISKLISDLIEGLDILDKQVKEFLQDKEITELHTSDLKIQFKGKLINN